MVNYKPFLNILACVILFAVPPQNISAQNKTDSLNQYIAELQKIPEDNTTREKIIALALSMNPAPAVPEDLERYMVRGKTALDLSKENKDYKKAINEFEKATLAAPWVSTAYYNLAISQELADDFAAALKSYKFYLLAEPNAADAKEVKTKIYELEYKVDEKKALGKTQFTDTRDGHIYKMVTIGTQTWMAENLVYKAYGRSPVMPNNVINLFGYRYNWEEAKLACPPGWHLPSEAEWTQLTDFLGGKKLAGIKFRETGFSVFPIESELKLSVWDFFSFYSSGKWWSSTEHKKSGRTMYYAGGSDVDFGNDDKSSNRAVRCIKD